MFWSHQKWLHSADDDRYTVLDDPMVQEMFQVMSERYPKFYEQKIQEWLKRDPETIVHGDFHAGNNMFGINKNEGDAVSFKYLVDKSKVEFCRVSSSSGFRKLW